MNLLIFWCPESAKKEAKELYSSFVIAFEKAIGVRKPIRHIETFEDLVKMIEEIKEFREKVLAEAEKISQTNARGKSMP